MNFRRFLFGSIRFHWRSHLGVVLGAAVGSAALVGALVIGHSVRRSLEDQARHPVLNLQEMGHISETACAECIEGCPEYPPLFKAAFGDGYITLQRISRAIAAFERTLLAGDTRAVAIGERAPRLPHTSNIAFSGLDRQALAMALDLAGVACSTGSACASGSSEPSPALVAMGLPDEQISGSIRFSLGATTTPSEIEEAARRILATVNRLRRE